MWKKLGIAVAAVLLILGCAVWYVYARIDSLILATIEANGSAAATTKVTVSSVALSIGSGHCVISGLIVGNPPGFSSPYALALGNITLHAEIGSLFGNGPIIVDEVDIDQPHIYYEVLGGGQGLSLSSLNLNSTSNLGTLQRNAQANAARSPASGPGRKEIIKDLYVTHGRISIVASLLGGRQISADLPEIHLTGVGEASGGATAAQAGRQVLTAITNQAALAGAAELVKAIGSPAAGPLGNALTNKVKSLF